MPGLKLYTSNRLEALAGKLEETLRVPPASPMTPEVVLVQSRGMERWLSLELAGRLGICANVRFPFPNHFIEEIFRAVLPDLPGSPAFDPEVLTWRVMGLLPRCLEDEGFEPLRAYLAGDGRGLKRYQLSRIIARLFDQYLVFRPDMVLGWEEGKDRHWQAALWRLLAGEAPGSHRAARWRAALARLQNPGPGGAPLPGRVSIFGISALPPFHLRILEAVARTVDVNLFVMNPCREYWYLIYSDREMRRLVDRLGTAPSDEALHLERGNSLLASMGALGRDFLRMVYDTGCEEADVSVEPAGGSLLSQIQSDILNLRDRGADGTEKTAVSAVDDSIRVHSCHSPMREVEVLQDRILEMLDRDPTLTPADILVMTPEIESYAPYIEAAFSVPRGDRRRIPFSVADRGLRRQSTLADAFLRLLDLEGSRMGATEVAAFLETDSLRRRFGLGADDPALIHRWIRDTGIRWGVDGSSRRQQGLPAFSENTWQAGIDRLLLGVALPARGDGVFMGIAPHEGVAEGEASTLGSFLAFLDKLFAFARSLEEPRDLAGWASHLGAALDEFFLPEGGEEDEAQVLRRALAGMARRQEQSGFDGKFGAGVLKACLEEALQETGTASGFLTGGVTFCAMLPMRSIPFRVVCLIGLDDAAYPRQTAAPGFDLMRERPRPGDRSRRLDDRYLFLEALLSAREKLCISYTGQSIQDNSERPPSVVVSELLDYVEQGFEIPGMADIRDALVVKHRLQAFSPEYFRGGALYSYSAENAAGAAASVAAPRPKTPFIASPLSEPPPAWRTVDVHALVRFFANPARHLLTRRLGLRLDEAGALLSDVEPMGIEGLEKYELGERLAARCIEGLEARELMPAARALGTLPPGMPGECWFQELCTGADAFAARVRPHLRGEPLGTIDLDCALGPFRLTGRLPLGMPSGLVHYRFAAVRSRDLLRAWIHHLALGAGAGERYPGRCVVLGREEGYAFGPVEGRERLLEDLLETYWCGLTMPLPFFPETARVYVSRLLKGKTGDEALRDAGRTWAPERGYAEGQDPYFRFCFGGGKEALDDRFRELAGAILGPLLEHAGEVR
ncbi:MAG: exodeoxyribonuclease V subunit gamma [Syntrophaceae bacterium]|nr:exodeoxyribonuclease V subunit gamma [Syntrophaceae bacterium]